MYEFEFEITRKDCDYYVRESEVALKRTLICSIALFAYLFACSYTYSQFAIGFIWHIFLLTCIIICLYVWFFVGRSLYKSLNPEDRKLKVCIDENSVDISSSLFRSSSTWGRIMNVTVTKHLILLYPTKNTAYIFPKRIFSSLEEMNSFIEFVKSKVNK